MPKKKSTKRRAPAPRPKRRQRRITGGAELAALEKTCFAADRLPFTVGGGKFKSKAHLQRQITAPVPKTYRIFTQLDIKVFERMLNERGWRKEPNMRIPVALLHIDGGDLVPGQRMNQVAIIKSKIQGKTDFADKDGMVRNASPAMKTHMKKSTTDIKELYDLKLPLYVKSATGARGEGNILCMTHIGARRAWMNTERPMAEEYIMDPYLLGGKKTHFRMYMLVTIFTMPNGDLNKKAFLCHEGLIATAAKPYVKADWNDKEIHDSHISSTDSLNFISKNPNYGDWFPRMIAICRDTVCYRKFLSIFPETRHAYLICGIDFMFDTNERKMYWTENNFKPGMSYLHGGKTEISEILFGGIVAAIDAYYAGKYAELNSISHFIRVW